MTEPTVVRGLTVDQRADQRAAIADDYKGSPEYITDALEWFSNLDDPQTGFPYIVRDIYERYDATPEFASVIESSADVGWAIWTKGRYQNVVSLDEARETIPLPMMRAEFIVALLNGAEVRAAEGDDRCDKAIGWLTGKDPAEIRARRVHPSNGGGAA